ncbi:uncharacterized protein EI90DRAFT_3133968 [Cantharellus anzutake]|uniref:uncharacterized protein n=1 Tax=Cantharellus anzutake TaxID=1750568 RepID=UPI0019080149|nr:uncharacterized protein EI90DRAFT_3133968 [Cantharellus anzutake]KAF8317232.1 hypothetical protein EI90DRAFT_3133968 [Cantharellus anzutake]
MRLRAETVFKWHLHLFAFRNGWDSDEVKVLEDSGVSDTFLESFCLATQLIPVRDPIKGDNLKDRVPADVLEAEIKRLAREHVYKHLEKIDSLLKTMAPTMRVLDFYGLPSLFMIDCERENHGVRILASQGLKDQREWDELDNRDHTLPPRSPDLLYSPNPPIGNQTEDLPRSHSSSQARLNASVASWRSGVQHMVDEPPIQIPSYPSHHSQTIEASLATNFRMPRLPAEGAELDHLM